nr:hypothetical protein REQ54_04784 [Rhizobium sp. Q54]
MANNFIISFCHQGNCQCASLPQGIDDGSLGPVTMRSTVERGGDERPDFFNVMGMFWSYNHEYFLANAARIAKTTPWGMQLRRKIPWQQFINSALFMAVDDGSERGGQIGQRIDGI